MDFEKKGYKFSLIDEPLQKHVVAWETAMRSLNSEDAKEMLLDVSKTLSTLKVTDRSVDALFSVLQRISFLITEAVNLLQKNETATLSSNRGNIVKAAIRSGWVISFEKLEKDVWTNILDGSVDVLPPWAVLWMAEEIAGLYQETQQVPND